MNKDTDTPIELNAQQISRICRSVEKSMGHVMSTPRDFDQLCESIFARTGALLSRNTLRRIWGKIDTETHPRRSTVVILLHFLGYRDAESFLREDGIRAYASAAWRHVPLQSYHRRGTAIPRPATTSW